MDKIYDEYFDKIYNWTIKKTDTREEAEDLTNDIFLAIHEYLNKNIKVEKMSNLIWKVAYNLWCTRAKKYIKEKNTLFYDENVECKYEDKTIEKIIYREIVSDIDKIGLSDNEVNIFNLYYLKDLSIKKISNILNITESNIKFYLFSIRKKIKERYDG